MKRKLETARIDALLMPQNINTEKLTKMGVEVLERCKPQNWNGGTPTNEMIATIAQGLKQKYCLVKLPIYSRSSEIAYGYNTGFSGCLGDAATNSNKTVYLVCLGVNNQQIHNMMFSRTLTYGPLQQPLTYILQASDALAVNTKLFAYEGWSWSIPARSYDFETPRRFVYRDKNAGENRRCLIMEYYVSSMPNFNELPDSE